MLSSKDQLERWIEMLGADEVNRRLEAFSATPCSLIKGRPSSQLFRTTHAPEVDGITPREIQRALHKLRPDTEWEVQEIDENLKFKKENFRVNKNPIFV